MTSDSEKRQRISSFEELERQGERDEGIDWRLGIGLILFVGFAGWLIYDGFDSQTYFFEVDEAIAHAGKLGDTPIRVKGEVQPGTVSPYGEGMGRKFLIAKNGRTLEVRYTEALPDTFQPGITVVAEGVLENKSTLRANHVLVKCPSRYEGEAPTAHKSNQPPGQNQ